MSEGRQRGDVGVSAAALQLLTLSFSPNKKKKKKAAFGAAAI